MPLDAFLIQLQNLAKCVPKLVLRDHGVNGHDVSWPGPVGPGEGRGEPLAGLIVVCDGLILGAPVRAAEPGLDAPTRGRVEEEERDLMSVFVLNDPPGVLRAEAGIGEHLLVQKDLSWRGAGASAVEDADRDLLVQSKRLASSAERTAAWAASLPPAKT